MSKRRNLRRVSMLVTCQTVHNLEKLANMTGSRNLGRTMDKLVREKMIALKEATRRPKSPWKDPRKELPEPGLFVFVLASGTSEGTIWSRSPAVAAWFEDGWAFEGYPEAELVVHGWMEVPKE